jgi:hypothetical protein
MKSILVAVCLASSGSLASADSDPKYADPNIILANLMELVETCQGMSDGQTNEEIFGILYKRTGDICQFQNGELDDGVRSYLREQKLDWAGVDGEHGLWVKATGVQD